MENSIVSEMPVFLIITGIVLLLIGLAGLMGSKYLPLGKLPGDIKIEKENFRLYLPLGSSMVVSIILSLLLWLFFLLRR